MKRFIKFRYRLSANGRENTLIVYAESVETATERVHDRLRAEYGDRYRIFEQRTEVFSDAQAADAACSNGLLDNIAADDLSDYLHDYANAHPGLRLPKRGDRKSAFIREVERRALQLPREVSA